MSPLLPLFVFAAWSSATAVAAERPSVLFIAVDDLRPELGCYGEAHMRTPHLDRLADEGRRFDRHYVQVPTCGASRYALLTGRRPSKTGALGNGAFSRLRAGTPTDHVVTLSESFRRAGYRTVCIGKISHHPDGRFVDYQNRGDRRLEVPFAFDEVRCPLGRHETPWDAFFAYADGSGRRAGVSPPLENPDVSDDAYPDWHNATAAIDALRRHRAGPFFLAVGFYKPHLPFNAPRRYLDLYPANAPVSPNPGRPEGVHPGSMHSSGELLRNYGGHPDREFVDEERADRLRRAYFAAVSYVDAQIGRLLDELDRLDLAKSTIVVVWGDHGWHLGDHGLWGKHSLFERSLRSTLIVRAPRQREPGAPAAGIVETLDLFPTLCELAGVESPRDLDGESFAHLLDDPDRRGKDGAFSYWRGGRSLRTSRHRLTVFPAADGDARIELFDHSVDPWETRNIAADEPETVADLMPRWERDAPSFNR